MTNRAPKLLGPFVGHTTQDSVKLWLYLPAAARGLDQDIWFTLHPEKADAPACETQRAHLSRETLGTATVTFRTLRPNTTYFYKLWESPGIPLDLDGLVDSDLHFRTFPSQADPDKLEFLLMSCHDPTQETDDGHDGYRLWAVMDQIRKANDIRFALLAGDQIYGDHVEAKLLNATTEEERLGLYLSVYENLWSHPAYRKILCNLPSYLMWDDHDITDGWGSRSDLFIDATSSEIRPEWQNLFTSARTAFHWMQASRNPEPLSPNSVAGYDFGFKIGKMGFVVMDLRSNRNVRNHQVWSEEQFQGVRGWIEAHKRNLELLFVVSPVVFTHGWPKLEEALRDFAPIGTALAQVACKIPIVNRMQAAQRIWKRNVQDAGGFRDDLEDAWASDPNQVQAEQILDYLFSLQNPSNGADPLPVAILSGDIHAAGYSMVVSSKPEHTDRPVIEHFVSSPVASTPMNWFVEGMYQDGVSTVVMGTSGCYTAQVSHHHCQRNVTVMSVRRYGDEKTELQLKAKFYLENRPQPEVVISDIHRVSHREEIQWETPVKSDPDLKSA